MGIQDAICPLCGDLSPGGGICGRCRAGQTSWLSCRPRVPVVRCPTCGARKEAGVWTDTVSGPGPLAREAALRAIRVDPRVQQPSISITLEDVSINRTRAHAMVSGTLFGVPVEGGCTVEIAWQKEQCDRCSRISGSYHEGVVQVRASGRKPAPGEVAAAARVAREIADSLQASGERLAFIAEMDETDDGLDITVGSQRLGREIVDAVTRSLGGRYTTHPKLVGEKDGRRLFRITYSIRLPRYTRGDVIVVGGRYGEVLSVEGKTVRFLDLSSGALRSVPEPQVGRRVGNVRDAREWLAAFQDRDVLGVVDPESGVTRECRIAPGRQVAPGTCVRVLMDGEQAVVLLSA